MLLSERLIEVSVVFFSKAANMAWVPSGPILLSGRSIEVRVVLFSRALASAVAPSGPM